MAECVWRTVSCSALLTPLTSGELSGSVWCITQPAF